MLNRLIRFALVGVFATAIAGYGVAYAQEGEEEETGMEEAADEGGDEGMDEGMGDEGGGEEVADEGGGEEAADTGGGDAEPAEEGEGMGLVLPKGKIAIMGAIEVNLSKDAVAKPFSIAPDVWYGVNEKLSVGLVHSAFGQSGFMLGGGQGLCLAGEDNGCAKVYNNVAVDAKYLVMGDGPLQLAANGGVNIWQLSDPMLLSIKVGVVGQYTAGKIIVGFAPNVWVGATERDFNKELLNVPVSAMFAVNPKLAAGIQVGISGPLDGFGDFYRVPLVIGGHYAVSDQISAGLGFGFTNIAGKDSSADGRTLVLAVGYML
jgi:hypothetical protein